MVHAYKPKIGAVLSLFTFLDFRSKPQLHKNPKLSASGFIETQIFEFTVIYSLNYIKILISHAIKL